MRPRKVVLLINDREQERNCWHLVFASKRYEVISEGGMPMELHRVPEVAVLRGQGLKQHAAVIRQLFPEMRILAISDSHDVDADVKLPAFSSMGPICEALKILAVRMRGPKKNFVVPVFPAVTGMESRA